jgi:hypothetical protein
MAIEKGYVKSTSFFRTHPPYFDRILTTFSEIEYLPKRDDLKLDSTDLRRIKDQMNRVLQEIEQERKKKPTLRHWPQCDEDETTSPPLKPPVLRQ